ncbi:dienelactone hydrolase family protein [Nocardia sp. alder85J]|uniref:dienelactone hydrolase family protein n=1 Tax=Nocardia sp. alder85J TaxID=2862949 RepID=UPI001CD47631|nr:dienelactone hydrolase family protein [Nocardia sp. alder85J]MCX4093825.1 dienelactone hydrolase family protein [Nocardia sp. alder85J]
MSGVYRDIALVRDRVPQTAGGPSAALQTRVPLTVVEPEGVGRGGIVVLHESREFAVPLLELMGSLAGDGWIVVAPHLFHRDPLADSPPDSVFGQDLFDDFDAAFDWLTGRGVFPDCVGVLGFDTAGTAAFLVATNRPIGAAISVAAPGIAAPLTAEAPALVHAAPLLQAPWLGLYGADDPTIPADLVDELRDAAAGAAVATLVVTCAGRLHRADQPRFDSADPADAVTRIFDWFDSHLR